MPRYSGIFGILCDMENKSLQIPYGVVDFKTLRSEGLYYVDKTGYIPLLEQAGRGKRPQDV